jgi:hypothetical protein
MKLTHLTLILALLATTGCVAPYQIVATPKPDRVYRVNQLTGEVCLVRRSSDGDRMTERACGMPGD